MIDHTVQIDQASDTQVLQIARMVKAAGWDWYAGADPEGRPMAAMYLPRALVRAFAIAMLEDEDAAP